MNTFVLSFRRNGIEELRRPPVLLAENNRAVLQAVVQLDLAIDDTSRIDFLDFERLVHGLHAVAYAGALAITNDCDFHGTRERLAPSRVKSDWRRWSDLRG